MAGKKKAKKKVGRPAKKKVRTKSTDAVAKAVKKKLVARITEEPEARHVYCVMTRYGTNGLCEFTTLEAAQECIEANKQINDLELCVVVMPGGSFRSTEW